MKRFISLKRLFAAVFFILLLAGAGLAYWVHDHYVVPILMYHRVSMADEFPLSTVTPKSFQRQMEYISRHGYHVISLDELVDGIKSGRKFPHKTVVITFDDGYKDNYKNAFPVLVKHHFPATIFLISDFLGINPNLLTWDQVKEMSEAGITFGSHTRHHVYLPEETGEQLKDEIVGSKRVIEEHLGKPVYYMSYPSGGFSEEIKSITAMAGYRAAVSTNRGYDRFNIDPYELSRIRINNGDTSIILQNKLSGYYNLFRKLRPSH